MGATILIVDDDPSARTTIEAILDGKGYVLEKAANGIEALQKAILLKPDLILLDVMMPGMDGFEVCRQMRANPALAEIPIVILTALEDHHLKVRGIESGADDYLVKPIDRQELSARVHTITRLNRYRTLLNQRENIRQLAERIISVQEEERKTISRELHDDLGQALIAHDIELHNLKNELSGQPDAVQKQIDRLIVETHEMLSLTRSIAQNLRPAALDTLGFPLAVTNYCQEFSLRTKILVNLEIDPSLSDMPDMIAVILYRIIQETLSNVLKHANASHVWIEFFKEDRDILLTIQDNGQGFPEGQAKQKGIGLIGIRERLELTGGSLVIHSGKNKGSILTIKIPLFTQTYANDEGIKNDPGRFSG